MARAPFRVLSLDGGGMRGTYTATYLQRVAEAFSKRREMGELDIGAAFDLIVGTSTGGIIACTLALGVPLNEIVHIYATAGKSIFPRKVPSGTIGALWDIFWRKRALRAGTESLKRELVRQLSNKTLGEVYKERGIALAIPAVELSQHRGWVFKTPHSKSTNHRDDKYTLVDVCLATSAAPVYRSVAAIDHHDSPISGFNAFVDGGLWANNPVLVGLIDALELTNEGDEIQIFCLGTCSVPAGEQVRRTELDRGLVGWKFGSRAASLAIDAQQFSFDHMAKKLASYVNRKCTILRFPGDKVPAALIQYLELDETRAEAIEALSNQARSDADMLNSRCAYRETDSDAEMICSLFESAPQLTFPRFKKK
jgi:uncharacterized protein